MLEGGDGVVAVGGVDVQVDADETVRRAVRRRCRTRWPWARRRRARGRRPGRWWRRGPRGRAARRRPGSAREGPRRGGGSAVRGAWWRTAGRRGARARRRRARGRGPGWRSAGRWWPWRHFRTSVRRKEEGGPVRRVRPGTPGRFIGCSSCVRGNRASWVVRRGCGGQFCSRDVVTSTGAVGQLLRNQPYSSTRSRFLEELTWQVSVPLAPSPPSPPCLWPPPCSEGSASADNGAFANDGSNAGVATIGNGRRRRGQLRQLVHVAAAGRRRRRLQPQQHGPGQPIAVRLHRPVHVQRLRDLHAALGELTGCPCGGVAPLPHGPPLVREEGRTLG